MSKISNSNVLTGDTASSSATNTKFSDVATATSSIDANNVRYEGVDNIQLKDNYLVVRRGYVDNEVTDATAGVAYSALNNGAVDSGLQAVGHVGSTKYSTGMLLDFSSDPLVLKDGDLLRIWHSCHLFNHEYGQMLSIGTGAYTGGLDKHVFTTFPMWSIGPTFSKTASASAPSGTGFEPFPGWNTEWTSTMSGSPSSPIQIQQPGMSGSSYNSLTYGLALYPLHGVSISSSEMRVRYTGGSTLNYLHQGSNLTVYGIRIFTLGPVYYDRYTSGSTTYLAFKEASTAIASAFNNVYFSMGHIGFMQMRGGSV